MPKTTKYGSLNLIQGLSFQANIKNEMLNQVQYSKDYDSVLKCELYNTHISEDRKNAKTAAGT
jgi:hypothetical protein